MTFKPSAALLKLTWANEHLESLHAEVEDWTASHPYRIFREREQESGFTVVYAEPLSQPPLRLSLILGDVLNSLRACLDYSALELSERGHGSPLSEGTQHACHFPICGTKELFAEARRSVIPHVPPGPRAVIQRAQPYHRGKDSQRHPLAVLKALADFDKHRRLPLVAQHAAFEAADVLSESWRAEHFTLTFPSVFETKTELFRSRGLTDLTGSEVDVDFRLAVDIAFAEGSPAAVVSEGLTGVMETIWQYVGREVVLPLKPYLE